MRTEVWKRYNDIYIHTVDLQIRRGNIAADKYLGMAQGMNVPNKGWWFRT